MNIFPFTFYSLYHRFSFLIFLSGNYHSSNQPLIKNSLFSTHPFINSSHSSKKRRKKKKRKNTTAQENVVWTFKTKTKEHTALCMA